MQLLPHGVPSRNGSNVGANNNNVGARLRSPFAAATGGGVVRPTTNIFSSSSSSSNNSALVFVVLCSAVPSFFLGTLVSLYTGIDACSHQQQQQGGASLQNPNTIRQTQQSPPGPDWIRKEDCQKLLVKASKQEAVVVGATAVTDGKLLPQLFPMETVGRFAWDMARVNKSDFVSVLDPGSPLDPPTAPGAQEVLLLYQHPQAMPNRFKRSSSAESQNMRKSKSVAAAANDYFSNGYLPQLSMSEAIENCHQVNLVLSDHSGGRSQCLAIMPQYESYHIQKWLRVDDATNKVIATAPLQMVSRGHQDNGKEQFDPPKLKDTKRNWEMLQHYLETLDEVTGELEPLLKKLGGPTKTVIVMVCNFGQAELLLNFICSAKARGFDLSNVLVFTTDEETTQLIQDMGLAVYYDHRNFGKIPASAAKRYGDRSFVAMMMAKVICVQLVSMLGYNLLFQDVDIVWYKNPLEYFSKEQPSSAQTTYYDIFFQDDGAHSVRYAPYSANSGFYFVRANPRTRHFLTSLLLAGDIVVSTHSHQQALIALLAEHVSLYGLKAKVLSRDEHEFPGGYQFHQKRGTYMKQFFAGDIQPYIFHMSWTLNKDNKLLFLRQMGEWFVQDVCIGKERKDIGGSDLTATCCAAEPLFSCHYRDKPSKHPCRDSPPIDAGRPSFW